MPRMEWEVDVRPVLVAVRDALDATDDLIRGADHESVHAALGDNAVSAQATFAALEELRRLDYIEGAAGFGDPPMMMLIKLLEKGRQEVSGWPASPGADYGAKLLDEIERRIAAEPDETKRTRLAELRDGIKSVGVGVVTALLADLARGA